MSFEPALPENSVASITRFQKYQEYLACRNNTEDLVANAKEIIQEHTEDLRGASKPGRRLDLLLHGMLDYAPCDEGARYVATVLRLAGEMGLKAVVEVANVWEHFLFKMQGLSTGAGPQRVRGLTKQVSKREQHYCPITGDYDAAIACSLSEVQYKKRVPDGVHIDFMQLTHIFPRSLKTFDSANKKDAMAMWDILRAWTGLDFEMDIRPAMDTPANVIFMTERQSVFFGLFDFYLDKEPYRNVSNKYRAKPTRTYALLFNGQNEKDVVFHTSDKRGNAIDPPDPRFLKTHAAFARVLSLSGVAGYISDGESDADGETDIELLLKAG